jgi:hypothetical protein
MIYACPHPEMLPKYRKISRCESIAKTVTKGNSGNYYSLNSGNSTALALLAKGQELKAKSQEPLYLNQFMPT